MFKFRKDDSGIMINPLVTYFPSESGLSSVIHPCYSLDLSLICLTFIKSCFLQYGSYQGNAP